MRSSRSRSSCPSALQQDTHLPKNQAHIQKKKKRSVASKQEAIWNWDLAFKTLSYILRSDWAKWDYVALLHLQTRSLDELRHPASLQLVYNNLHCYQPTMKSHNMELCQHNTAGNSSNCFLVNRGAGMKKGGGKGKAYLCHAHGKTDFTHVCMNASKLASILCDFFWLILRI